MGNKHLSDVYTNKLSYIQFMKMKGDTNNYQLKLMKEMAIKALRNELTERQQQIFTLYYGEEINTPTIAKILNLNQSTVSRHLTTARKKLQKIFDYNMIGLQIERNYL